MRLMKYIVLATLSAIAANVYATTIKVPPVHHPLRVKPQPKYMLAGPQGLTPDQVKRAYGIDRVSGQGEGQIIAIIGAYDDPDIGGEVGAFDAAFNLPPCKLAKVYSGGTKPGPDPDKNHGWTREAVLDVEWAHAIAPAATIYLVEAPDPTFPHLYEAVTAAVAAGANVVSMSWGSEEGDWVSALNMNKYFNQSPNVNFVASSGDGGHQVNFPAVSPYVLSVGGTTLTFDPQTGRRKAEVVWNNMPHGGATGGGLSAFKMPASDAQKEFGLPGDNPSQYRGVPDVSYNSDDNTSPYPIYSKLDGGWMQVGGTSAAAPQWAAIIAIANGMAKKSIPVNRLIYRIAKLNPLLSFFDITSGKNGDCGYFCNAQAGYDYVTGLGAPRAGYIINQLIIQSQS